jgi:hypothetical protein
MVNSGVISKGALATGVLGVGLVSGLAAASLGMTGVAVASCVNFSGIAIGGGGPTGHCQAAFGSIAIVIGPTPADGVGSDAFAGNPSQFSLGNIAISVGGTVEQPTSTSAGQLTATGLPNIGNVSFATAGSSASTQGLFNLGASLGGTRSQLIAAGVGNSALNLGSDNLLVATGTVNNATNLSGNGNGVASSNTPGTGLAALVPGLNVAFNILGTNNTVLSGASVPPVLGGPGNGPLSIAGAIGVTDQNGADTVRNTNFGIELRTPFNAATPPPMTSVLATGNKVTPKTLAAGIVKNTGSQSSGSLTKAGTQVRSSLNSLSTKVSNTVKKVTGGLAGGAKADAARTNNSD